jgi:NhaP-type Na+/H+ or K+/H+ antiporter
MEVLSTEVFTTVLALVGIVIMIAALFSGLIERSNLPQVAIFLGLGAVLGPAGLGMINIGLDSPALRIVATLSLALVLFTDALTLDINEVRKHAPLAVRVLGPGTILSAVLIALAGWALLGLHPAAAAILGAALASTDPVLLRGLLRYRGIPAGARQALRLESGLNDVVLLPIVLVAMVFLSPATAEHGPDWARMGLDLFLLGPGAGIAVGLLGVATLDLVRRRIGIRRDYESLYSLGVAFAAFAAAEAVHGSGFLAVFAAGLTISALDVELCDCFLEYGETTAELALLFTFVLLGSSLIWSGFGVATVVAIIFAVLVLLLRPVVYALSLFRSQLQRKGRIIVAWFGPRGLSSLLLVLLPVFDGIPGSDYLFAVCCLVVLLSVTVHGGSLVWLGRLIARKEHAAEAAGPAPGLAPAVEPPLLVGAAAGADRPASAAVEDQDREGPNGPPAPPGEHRNGREGQRDAAPRPAAEPVALLPARPPRPPVPRDNGAAEQEDEDSPDRERISIAELRQLWKAGKRVVVLDVRTQRTFDSTDYVAEGAVRLSPENAVHDARALGLPRDAWLVAFCA